MDEQGVERPRIQREQRIGDAVGVIQRDRAVQPRIQALDRLGRQRMGQRLVDDVAPGARVEGLYVQHERSYA